MGLRELVRAGHWPTLLCAFLYFGTSCMLWMLLGALAIDVAQELALAPAARGLLVAVPVLAGAALRLPAGAASDRWGARRVATAGMGLTFVPLLWAGFAVRSYAAALGVGALLGVAGASFAVALPLAGRSYPADLRGLAMGIAGAGNSGTVVAALLAPRLAELVGWRAVFGLAALPLLAVLTGFAAFARDPEPTAPTRSSYGRVLRKRDVWWFNLFYAITFGGFIGLASFLPLLFFDEYGSSRVEAGTWTAACLLAGSFLRPVGGHLADRLGGVRVLKTLLVAIIVLAAWIAQLPVLGIALPLLVVAMGCLGMGNGAVFQLVGRRFPEELGVVSGLVGAFGGVGGFLLPLALGVLKGATGSYAPGFAAYAVGAGTALAALAVAEREWQRRWLRSAAEAPAP